MSRAFPWNVLGIDVTRDKAAIRKAYAEVLRGITVDEDIAGYTNLRRARDEALWLAAQGDRQEESDFGLGSLDDDDADVGFDDGDDWHQSPETFPPEALHDRPAAELTEALTEAQTAWQALLDILYPGGEVSDDSVTYAEMEEGLAHLTVLLDHADRADLVEHDALDGALADVFARTWPRSAPFVEPANAALHWLDEAGQIEERPALMFLNQRIKGMRFHEKVQESDHPLHKAWAELSRPGRAGFVDRLRVRRLDVDKLLTGVRQHYPELESYLAPERVASWEGSTGSDGVSDAGPRNVRWIFVLVLVGSALARIGGYQSDSRNDDPRVAPEEIADINSALVNLGVGRIFGGDMDMDAVEAADPVLADQLLKGFDRIDFATGRAQAFVRQRALTAGEIAEFDELVARSELRRLWLTAAQRQAPGVCANMMKGDFISVPLKLTEEEEGNERKLLRQLLDARVLSHEAKGGAFEYAVPGWMVGEAISLTGLSEAALTAALRDASDPNRCKVERALLDIIVAKPGRVSPELLRGL